MIGSIRTVIQFMKILSVVAAVALTGAVKPAHADDWPSKPIKMVVAFSPGGGTDKLARNIATFLQEELGQPVVVENRPGAGALLAHTYFLQQPDDGYTMLSTVPMPYLAVQTLTQDVNFTVDDFAFINLPRNDYSIIAVSKDSSIHSIDQLIELMKTKPEEVKVGVNAPSGADHINLRLFSRALGLDLNKVRVVNYNGGSDLRVALAGGNVDVAFTGGLAALVQKDLLDPIMVFRDEPTKDWPSPTYGEVLEKHNATGKMVPGSIGGFVMHASFRDKYPERWNKLVAVFKKIADDPARTKILLDQKLWAEWLGPEKSTKLVKSALSAYEEERELLKPK